MAFRICTIGCGKHSTLVHGPSYEKYVRERPDTVLAACCDLRPERADAYRDRFGFQRSYTELREMLKREKPDAVCVIVPEPYICQTSLEVMEAGFPVLLEKPPGLCRAETLKMIGTAERTGVINQVAFNRRYLPLMETLKRELKLHARGTVQNLFYAFYRFGRREPSFETTAIHGIDAAKYILGSDYKEVRFTYQELSQYGEKVANFLLECVFENGVTARLDFCPCTGTVIERLCVTALDQTFFLRTPIWDGMDAPGEYLRIKGCAAQSRISGLELTDSQEMFETNGFYRENFDFFENVRAGRRSGNDISSALQSVEIAEAIKLRAPFWRQNGGVEA